MERQEGVYITRSQPTRDMAAIDIAKIFGTSKFMILLGNVDFFVDRVGGWLKEICPSILLEKYGISQIFQF